MRLIGYVRVSTDEQAGSGHSLGQQPQRLQAYCDLHGHTLVRVLADEGVSASIPLRKRAGGGMVLAALKADDADGVVVLRLDRLFRDALDGLEFFNRTLRNARVSVHSISELIDTSTPAGKLALTLQLATAQYERDVAVQRAIECNTSLRRAGRVYGGIPYGVVALDGRLYRDPELWPQREAIIERLRAGASLRTLRQALAAEGVVSPGGKARWSINTLNEMRKFHDDLSVLPMAQSGLLGTPIHDAEVSSVHSQLH